MWLHTLLCIDTCDHLTLVPCISPLSWIHQARYIGRPRSHATAQMCTHTRKPPRMDAICMWDVATRISRGVCTYDATPRLHTLDTCAHTWKHCVVRLASPPPSPPPPQARAALRHPPYCHRASPRWRLPAATPTCSRTLRSSCAPVCPRCDRQ